MEDGDLLAQVLPPDETGFIVVECKRAINQNNNRVCVPKAWITCKIGPGKKVAFGYPAGDEESIAMRIKNKEPADNSWETYIGEKIIESESYEDAVEYLQTICGGNSEQIEDTSNPKSYADAVGCLQTICGQNCTQVEESNAIEPVTEPKNPLKLRIVIPKLDLKSQKKKKSEKKHHKKHLKEHSKDKVHKSKHRYMERLSLTGSISERSSPNSADSQVGTESCVSGQSNCQSSKSSSKRLELEISNSVHSAPETHLKNNNNNSYSSNRTLLERLDAEKENNDGMLSEDRQLVENMYVKIKTQVQFMETALLEMKKSQLIATENKKVLVKLAAKYRIPLYVTDSAEREKERSGDPFEEETLQNDEMETQDGDIMENEAQVTEENGSTSEENLLEERKNTERLLESDSDNQMTDDESTEDYLPPSRELVKYKGKAISKENDIWTLKHQRPGKGLIQIGRNSRIYISAKGLEKAKRTCTDVKQFARQLYREVFTPKALATCSMTGSKRPALHYEARTILKEHALKYGEDVGWDSIEPKELENNLSRLLHNSRRNILRRKKT